MDAIHFKFTRRATLKQREAVLEAIAGERAKVRAQFPREKDKDLSDIHVVEGSAGAIKKLHTSLAEMSGVEYVEKRAKRKLIG